MAMTRIAGVVTVKSAWPPVCSSDSRAVVVFAALNSLFVSLFAGKSSVAEQMMRFHFVCF